MCFYNTRKILIALKNLTTKGCELMSFEPNFQWILFYCFFFLRPRPSGVPSAFRFFSSLLGVWAWKKQKQKKRKKKNRMLNICDEYCRKAEKKLARKLILQLKRKDYNLGFHHIRCLNFPVLSLWYCVSYL